MIELRLDGLFRSRPERPVDVCVHGPDHRHRGVRAGRHRGADLLEPLEPMRLVRGDHRTRAALGRAVPRQQVMQPSRRDDLGQVVERREVVVEPAVRVRDDRRTSPEHSVPGQEGTVGGQHEAHRVGRVAGRRHDHQPYGGGLELACFQRLSALAQRRVQCPDRGCDQVGQGSGRAAVVQVAMGQKDQFDGTAAGPCLLYTSDAADE